jgi:hypothetical protein
LELTVAGYRLVRLPRIAATHPAAETLSEPFRRWRRGHTRGTGQAIRRSLHSPQLLSKHLYRIRHRLVVAAWFALGVASLATGAGVLQWFGFVPDRSPALAPFASPTTHVVRSLTGEWRHAGVDRLDPGAWRPTFAEEDTG